MNYLSWLALLITLATTATVIWAGKRESVAPLLTVAWVIYLLLWNCIPLMLQQTPIGSVENSAGPWSREELAVLQAGSLLMLALLHLAIRRPYVTNVRNFFDRLSPPAARLFWPTVVVLFLVIAVELSFSRVVGGSFSEVVAFAVTADATQQGQNGVLELLMGLLVGFSIAVISIGARQGMSRATLIVAWMTLLVFSAFSIARGTRAVVLLPLATGLIAISTLQGRARRRAIATIALLGSATVIVGAPVAGIMGVAREGTEALSFSMVENAFTYLFAGSTLGSQVQLLASEVNRKFDGVGPGVELLAMEPQGTGGLNPILSASLSPIPRIVFATKPVPNSRDGTYLGSPYRIAAKAYGDPELGMVVPVSPSAVSLWEFGALGPLALILANLLNLVLLNSVFLSRNVLARAVGISMLGLPNVEYFVAAPSLLLQNGLRILLWLCMLAALLLLIDLLRRSLNAGHAARRIATVNRGNT